MGRVLNVKNKAFKRLLSHRYRCPKWGSEFCIDCFGGDLKNFFEEYFEAEKEAKKK